LLQQGEYRLKSSVAFLVTIYALAVVAMAIFQRRFLYFPDRRLTHPAEAGMSGIEELRLTTDDGEMLVAWHFPPREGHPLILYFHGNGGALVDRVPRFRMFAASGYGLLAISYRGYGGSTGTPTQTGLMRDGEAAYREARARGYDGDRIVLMANR
jgi:dipeptidyl aminopeptidase/acylaminoacyl peptidase